jgi:hypothetical protein
MLIGTGGKLATYVNFMYTMNAGTAQSPCKAGICSSVRTGRGLHGALAMIHIRSANNQIRFPCQGHSAAWQAQTSGKERKKYRMGSKGTAAARALKL